MSKKKAVKGRPRVGKDATYFGRNLRYIRKGTWLAQDQMAEVFGIERATYQTYESGNNHPSPPRLIAMCDTLGRTVDEMLREDLAGAALAASIATATSIRASLDAKKKRRK